MPLSGASSSPAPPFQPRLYALTAVILAPLVSPSALAASDAERIKALEQRVLQLEQRLLERESGSASQLSQKVKVLERKLEIKEEEAKAAVLTTPVVSAGEKGFALEARDKSFVFKLRGLVHTDVREFINDEALPSAANSILFRRVRPAFEGTLYGLYDFKFMPDFAGGRAIAVDAYADLRFTPKVKLKIGKFKPPVGLERLQSASDLRFIERALPTNLVPNRDLGIQLHGDLAAGKLNYAVGVFNGVADGASSDATADVDSNGDKEFAARLFVQPFGNSDLIGLRGFSFGLAGSHTDHVGGATNSLLPTYRSPGQQNVFAYRSGTLANGSRDRLSPQFTWYYGSFGALGEYVRVTQELSRGAGTSLRRDALDHDSWQLALTYVLTGEEASFQGIKLGQPFKINDPGWGAFEVAARYNTALQHVEPG